ncbi:hypothetical protein [Micromonospora lutea]|uniref:Membrane protein DUF2157 n=1 Tax=Micromonospora lutea TaxID=419825 RepID=A0ABQ4ITL8_9ACTN|nr:hypothetical protein [Micromonospora lutea]GIJ21254.1 hypothetical protein Vlu01_18780 [Micromonospora lutea]
MRDLERRYRRLLRAYPTDYRRDRADEIVGTYLELADPRRRWPSPADAADLVRGGLRQRLRAAGVTDLIPGVRLAALLALTTAAFLAGFWAIVEQSPVATGAPRFGPFASAAVVAWLVWLLSALLALVAPGRLTRVAITVAVLATAAVPVLSLATSLPRPPLLLLVPQVALGVLALAVDEHLARSARALPIIAATSGGLAAWAPGNDLYWGSYQWTSEQLLPAVGAALLGVVLLLAVGLAMRQDWRGGWAVAALLTPIGLLSAHILAGAVDGLGGAPHPTYPTLVSTALTVGLLGPVVLLVAVALRLRRVDGGQRGDLAGPGAGDRRQLAEVVPAAGDRTGTGRTCPTCGTRR